MVLIAALIVFAVTIGALYVVLQRRSGSRSLWRTTFRLGVAIGVVRAALASIGWYVVEHTGGPLQVPAFALSMLAWPEGAIISERRVKPEPPEFYLYLSLLLIAGTVLFVTVVAALIELGRRRRS